MAIYICDVCDNYKDGDYFPCVEHPKDSSLLCCEECASEIEYKIEQDELKKLASENQREVEAGLKRQLK